MCIYTALVCLPTKPNLQYRGMGWVWSVGVASGVEGWVGVVGGCGFQ